MAVSSASPSPASASRVPHHDVIVLGAGMVGVCTALHLAQRGHRVTLVDRREPGRETSYGNAGIIQRESIEPYPFPRAWGTLLRVALGRGADVHYHPGALPALAGPLVRYWHHSAPARHARIARAYGALIEHCLSEHAPLIHEAGADDLVRREGYLHVFRERATLRTATAHARELADRGVRHRVLDSDALAAAEPALRRRLAGAVHWTDPWSVSDPGELVSRYAALARRLGARMLAGDATTLRQTPRGWAVRTAEGEVDAAHAVVALGPWSDPLLRGLGYRYPLFPKRGYHQHYTGGEPPRLTLLDADGGYVIAPMRRGVRITTGAEFARLDAPPTPVQVARAHRLASDLLDLPRAVDADPWLGARPATADMLPVIGPAPRHRGLWFNFGHAHQGFTLGPLSGRLMAELIEGGPTRVDMAPYSASRFG